MHITNGIQPSTTTSKIQSSSKNMKTMTLALAHQSTLYGPKQNNASMLTISDEKAKTNKLLICVSVPK